MEAKLRESFLRELMLLQLDDRLVDILLLSEQSSSQKVTGRSLSANFVACDTGLTHILLNDLKTPIGTQPSALVRLNDVIAITYH